MKEKERIYRHGETSEKVFERRLVTQMKKSGFLAVKMTDPMNAGLPDRLIVMPEGRVVWIELKSTGCKPTALQEARIKELRAMGHIVYVVTDKAELDMVIDLLQYYGS